MINLFPIYMGQYQVFVEASKIDRKKQALSNEMLF